MRNSWEARVFLALVFLGLWALAIESYGSVKGPQEEVFFSDWVHQDAAGKADQCFKSDTDSTVERAIIEKVFAELGTDGAKLHSEFVELQKAKVVGNDPRWRNLIHESIVSP